MFSYPHSIIRNTVFAVCWWSKFKTSYKASRNFWRSFDLIKFRRCSFIASFGDRWCSDRAVILLTTEPIFIPQTRQWFLNGNRMTQSHLFHETIKHTFNAMSALHSTVFVLSFITGFTTAHLYSNADCIVLKKCWGRHCEPPMSTCLFVGPSVALVDCDETAMSEINLNMSQSIFIQLGSTFRTNTLLQKRKIHLVDYICCSRCWEKLNYDSTKAHILSFGIVLNTNETYCKSVCSTLWGLSSRLRVDLIKLFIFFEL